MRVASGYHSKFHRILPLPRKMTLELHQILRLPRKMTVMTDPRHIWNAIYNARNNRSHPPTSPNTAPATQNDSPTFQRNFSKTAETSFPMRGRSENDPSNIRAGNRPPQPASQLEVTFRARIFYWKIQHFALRLSFQISPNTAPATKSDSSTSPNTAPATQSNCHDWSSSHMKRYLQCAEQQVASSNITKYCACHAKWFSKISETFLQNRWNVNYNARPIRAGSDHDPRMKPSLRNPPRNRGYFSRPPQAFCIEKYNISRSGYHSKFHQILRLPRKVTPQLHKILRLPRKMVQCAEQQVASFNITKYCACHAKWLSWLILVTYEMLFTMRGTTGGILQHHQILRLPRKMILQNFRNISPKHMKSQLQCATDPSWIRAGSDHDPTMIREWNRHSATRLATEVTFHAHHRHFVLKNTTFRAPAIIPNFTKYCACHEKWHFNFTKYCACHEKWHLNVPK